MKIVMLFPGYGSQFVGMAKELYDSSRLVQEYFEEASNCLNENFVKLCFASSEAELAKLDRAYVSIFLVSSAVAALIKQEGICPELVAGFGVGEYSALCAVGGLSFPDGLYFLSKYAYAYTELLSTLHVSMIRVEGISKKSLEHICAAIDTEHLWPTISWTNEIHAISGQTPLIEKLESELQKEKYTVTSLPLGIGLHRELMKPVVESLQGYIEKIDFKDIETPLCLSLNGKMVHKGSIIKEQIMKSIVSPIMWHKILKSLEPFDCIIEVGPGSLLQTFVKKIYPEKKILSVNKLSDLTALTEWVNQSNTQSEQPKE